MTGKISRVERKTNEYLWDVVNANTNSDRLEADYVIRHEHVRKLNENPLPNGPRNVQQSVQYPQENVQ